jgi:2-amino-4-hydroxy-6-hydroxymethyldihydropteridine diphosphokinase
MARVFLSLGSNLGDRLECLRRAVGQLVETPGITFTEASRLYRAEPWERAPGSVESEEDWFLNCVVVIETSLGPRGLLDRLQTIEADLGRVAGPGTPEDRRFEPRPLDIDILLYGDRVVSAPDNLHIPHLLMHERGFVLRPLADVAPEMEHPVLYETIRELLAHLEDEHRVRLSEFPPRWWER